MDILANNMEFDLNKELQEMDFNSNKLQKVNKNLMLTNKEIEVLSRYDINYSNCQNLKEVLFEIEEILNDMDIVDEDLDLVSASIAERDYYQNTNK